jgi:hypothetical protein
MRKWKLRKGFWMNVETRVLVLLLTAMCLVGCQQTVWTEYTSLEGGFLVSFPGAPTELARTLSTEGAGDIEAHICIVKHEHSAYGIMYADYPESYIEQLETEHLFDIGLEGAVAGSNATLLSESTISLDGHPGREVKAKLSEGGLVVRTRMYLVGNRLYQVIATVPEDQVLSSNVDVFLNSFALLQEE